ncbi:deoxyribonuclease V [Candidatus Viridilinea mediisalina]|uniref:Endonuclease V n=1 Tax=Candidatus Viridilinea mediisalina TaxID=2024553 RepID=A0A2A6RLB6_9CHLR|nr:deoxyribonuclease V [Candidatus Viridilinea mediisalina]PDW03640.1 endonuclease V [Candidatus Viridilinea mediisalina]
MDWPTRVDAALALQQALRTQVHLCDEPELPRTVAGVDGGFVDNGATVRAAAVLLRLPDLQPVAQAVAYVPVRFPYVPSLLSFREAPAIIAALEQLGQRPDLVICDGQGLAHPRRFGLACHLGVYCDLPTIGCAKTRLIGQHEPLGNERGACTALMHEGEQLGWVLRTRSGVKPVYVSPGHRVSLARAANLVMACTTRYRLPEPTRLAHQVASGKTVSVPSDKQNSQ